MRGWWGFGVEGQTAWRILTSKLPCHSLSHHKLVPSALRGVGSITLVAKCPWLILHELPMPFRAGTIFFFPFEWRKINYNWTLFRQGSVGEAQLVFQCGTMRHYNVKYNPERKRNLILIRHIFLTYIYFWTSAFVVFFFLSFPGITKKIILYKSKSQS